MDALTRHIRRSKAAWPNDSVRVAILNRSSVEDRCAGFVPAHQEQLSNYRLESFFRSVSFRRRLWGDWRHRELERRTSGWLDLSHPLFA